MSLVVSGLTTYVNEQEFPLVGALQVAPEMTVSKGVTIRNGIKGSVRLHFGETDVIFQSGGGCSGSAAGTTTLTEKTLEVGRIRVKEEICFDDLVEKYAEQTLKQGLLNGKQTEPSDFAAFYYSEKQAKINNQLELSDWQGDTTSGAANWNKYDGWIKFIDAGSPVDGNTDNQTTVSLSNVVAAVRNMYMAIPDALKYRTDLVLFLPYSWHQMYCQALITANLYHFKGDEASQTYIIGTNVKLIPTYGLSAGTLTTYGRMFLTYPSNLVLGMDLESDKDVTMRIDPVTNEKVIYEAQWSRGTQVMFPEHVVEFTLHGS